MKISTMPATELTAAQRARWSAIQRSNTALQSPFLCPEFTLAAATVRTGIEVAVLEANGEIGGFLPFQRGRRRTALPVASGLSEWDAMITDASRGCDVRDVLRACGLKSFRFDHLITTQAQGQNGQFLFGDAPYIDLSGGFAAYTALQRQAGSDCIVETRRKMRKLERECGPLRFELESADRVAFEQLLLWKANQNRRTGLLDIFRFDWVRELLDVVRQTHSAEFAGLLSTLHVGDELAAVHLGPRSESIAHLWFTAYNPRFAKYSPGIILLLEMARGLAERGIQRIDLGPGPQRYKQQLKSGDLGVARGIVDRSPAIRTVRRGWHGIRDHIRSGPLGKVARIPAHLLFRIRQWHEFHHVG